jgi:hypothetical protein
MSKAIVVKRSVLAAAREMKKLSDIDRNSRPFDLAKNKIRECQISKDDEGEKFWRNVWLHLLLDRCAPAQLMTSRGQAH